MTYLLIGAGLVVGYVATRLGINQARWNSEFGLVNARRKNGTAFIAALNTEK